MAGEVKNYLYSWCGKQKKGQPVYEAIPNGPQRFNYKVSFINRANFELFIYHYDFLKFNLGPCQNDYQ